jgi:hypothetical protein
MKERGARRHDRSRRVRARLGRLDPDAVRLHGRDRLALAERVGARYLGMVADLELRFLRPHDDRFRSRAPPQCGGRGQDVVGRSHTVHHGRRSHDALGLQSR